MLLLLSMLFLAAGTKAHAQGVFSLFSVDQSGFPDVSARFVAADADGVLIRSLAPEDFLIRENGVPRSVLSVSCAPLPPPASLSSVLMMDVSSSMAFGGPNIDIARAAARAWINALPLGASDCAIASFDHNSYLNQDFTTNRDRLHAAVAGLSPQGGTDYNAGLIGLPAGGIGVAERGTRKRIVVFLTDGEGEGDADRIVARALDAGVTIYCVTIGMPAPEVLRSVAERTGGFCFENVRSSEEAERVYRAILAVAQGAEPCHLVWKSDRICGPFKTLSVTIPSRAIGDTVSLSVPFAATGVLEYDPVRVNFHGVPVGGYRDTTMTITARNQTVTVRSIGTSDPRFTLVGGGVPPAQVLRPGESLQIRVRFAPSDSGFAMTALVVESSACSGVTAFLTGGYPGRPASRPTLRVIHPNGGEELPVGADTVLAWDGVPDDAAVRLEYSTDAGVQWNMIGEGVMKGGGSLAWKVPATPGRRCLFRVSQLSGGDDALALHGHTGLLSDARFSHDGRLVATCGIDSTVRIWNADDGALLTVITPGSENGGKPGWVRSVEFSPDGRAIVVGCDDAIIRLYEPTTGTLLREIGPGGGATFNGGCVAAFSPDGGRIAAGYIDGSFRVFALDGNLQLIGRAHLSFLTSVRFSPDGRFIATGGGYDRSVGIWDAATGATIQKLTQQPSEYGRGAIWSDDGALLAVLFDGVTVYSWPSLTLLRTIRDSVHAATFSPDGRHLVTGNWTDDLLGGTLDVYDVASGDRIRTYTHNTEAGGVYPVWFSPDGRRIISAGVKNVAKIWEFSPLPLQVDSSDSLWAIVTPVGSAREIDLGAVVLGDARDSLVPGYLCNAGDGRLAVLSMFFEGDADFRVLSGDAPFVLESGECHAVEFRFRPSAPGVRIGRVAILTAADTLRYGIRGEGLERLLELDAPIIDFGVVEIGRTKDTTVDVVLRNIGSQAVHVESTHLLGPDPDQFTIEEGGGAFTLGPGDGRAMRLRFAPARSGRTTGRIGFRRAGSVVLIDALLAGEGRCPSDEASHALVLGAPEAERAPGETISLPLVLVRPSNLQRVAGRYSMEVQVNRRVLLPLDTGVATLMRDGDTLLRYAGTWNGDGDTLAVLNFLVALGDAAESDVRIVSFQWDWECPVAVDLDRTVVGVRLCREGERPRLFLDEGEIMLKPLYPNPADDHVVIEFSTLEQGATTELFVVGVSGRMEGLIAQGHVAAGDHRVLFDLSGLPPGLYHCILKTATRTISRPFQVVR